MGGSAIEVVGQGTQGEGSSEEEIFSGPTIVARGGCQLAFFRGGVQKGSGWKGRTGGETHGLQKVPSREKSRGELGRGGAILPTGGPLNTFIREAVDKVSDK